MANVQSEKVKASNQINNELPLKIINGNANKGFVGTDPGSYL